MNLTEKQNNKLYVYAINSKIFFQTLCADANQEVVHANRDGSARRRRWIGRSYLCRERENQDHSFLRLPPRRCPILKISHASRFLRFWTIGWYKLFGFYFIWWRNGWNWEGFLVLLHSSFGEWNNIAFCFFVCYKCLVFIIQNLNREYLSN